MQVYHGPGIVDKGWRRPWAPAPDFWPEDAGGPVRNFLASPEKENTEGGGRRFPPTARKSIKREAAAFHWAESVSVLGGVGVGFPGIAAVNANGDERLRLGGGC